MANQEVLLRIKEVKKEIQIHTTILSGLMAELDVLLDKVSNNKVEQPSKIEQPSKVEQKVEVPKIEQEVQQPSEEKESPFEEYTWKQLDPKKILRDRANQAYLEELEREKRAKIKAEKEKKKRKIEEMKLKLQCLLEELSEKPETKECFLSILKKNLEAELSEVECLPKKIPNPEDNEYTEESEEYSQETKSDLNVAYPLVRNGPYDVEYCAGESVKCLEEYQQKLAKENSQEEEETHVQFVGLSGIPESWKREEKEVLPTMEKDKETVVNDLTALEKHQQNMLKSILEEGVPINSGPLTEQKETQSNRLDNVDELK